MVAAVHSNFSLARQDREMESVKWQCHAALVRKAAKIALSASSNVMQYGSRYAGKNSQLGLRISCLIQDRFYSDCENGGVGFRDASRATQLAILQHLKRRIIDDCPSLKVWPCVQTSTAGMSDSSSAALLLCAGKSCEHSIPGKRPHARSAF